MSAIDLGTVAAAGERVARAGAMLDAMVAASRDLLTAGPIAAFAVIAEGNADLDPGTLGDVLAAAVLRLAERDSHA